MVEYTVDRSAVRSAEVQMEERVMVSGDQVWCKLVLSLIASLYCHLPSLPPSLFAALATIQHTMTPEPTQQASGASHCAVSQRAFWGVCVWMSG